MIKILLVEDDSVIVSNLTVFKKKEGYAVKSVSGQRDALDLLGRESRPCIDGYLSFRGKWFSGV